MRRPTCWMLTAFVLVSAAASASAQTVHVPGDYATIQGAINSGATLVYVGTGSYSETVTLQRTMTLLPEPTTDPRMPTPIPLVAGMSIVRNSTDDPVVYVRGLHFSGAVTQTNVSGRSGITTIEGCRLDGGFTTNGCSGPDDAIKIRSCVITGDVFVWAYFTDFSGNMVWKGRATVASNGGNGALLRDNLVIGPSTDGLLITSNDTYGLMTGNTVVGVTTGYTVMLGTASGNVAQDCGGSGFVNKPAYNSNPTFTGNIVRRCGNGFA